MPEGKQSRSTKQNRRPADGVVETWAYMGRRLLRGGKISHAWLDQKGEEVIFDKLKATVVGGDYELEVVRKPEGGASVYTTTVKYVGKSSVGSKKIGEWELEDRSARTEELRRSKESKAKKEEKALGDLTIKEVALLIRRSPSQRSAMIATVINEITFGGY